jgi:hypothetical protein
MNRKDILFEKYFSLEEIEITDFYNKEIEEKINNYYNTRIQTKKNPKPYIFENLFKANISLIGRKLNNSRFRINNNLGFNIGMMSLSPHNLAGENNCIMADKCKFFCHGHKFNEEKFETSSEKKQIIQKIIKSTFLYKKTELFLRKLCIEIANFIKSSYNPVIRLNGYSDIKWESDKYKFSLTKEMIEYLQSIDNHLFSMERFYYRDNILLNHNLDKLITKNIVKKELKLNVKYSIMEIFEGVLFYDYTKFSSNKRNIELINNQKYIKYKNYHIVYSFSVNIYKKIAEMNKLDDICIIVKKSIKKTLIEKYVNNNDFNIINGDEYDNRLLDRLKIKNNRNIGYIILLEGSESTKLKEKKLFEKDKEIDFYTTAETPEIFEQIIKYIKKNVYK